MAARTGRDVVLKLRQVGFTTLTMAVYFIDALMLDGVDVAIIGHKKTVDVLRPLREKLSIFMESVRDYAPELLGKPRYDAMDYVSWEDRKSSFRIISCGGGSPLQSSTVHRAHFTEMALMEGDVEAMVTGALDAVPVTGSVTFESRGSSPSGYFYDFYQDSKSGLTGYKTHFFGIPDFPEYTEEFIKQKKREYRGRMHLFKQQYPMTDEEAFQAAPNCYFADCPLEVEHEPSECIKSCQYIIGGDPGTGVDGGNPSALAIKEIPSGKFVFTWKGLERPRAFAIRLHRMSIKYNDAIIAPERNIEQEGVCGTLEELGANLYYDDDGKPGIRTDINTRPIMLQEFAESLCDGTSTLCDAEAIREAKSFCLQKNGKYEANEGAHDDLLFAHLVAHYVAQRPVVAGVYDPPGEGMYML